MNNLITFFPIEEFSPKFNFNSGKNRSEPRGPVGVHITPEAKNNRFERVRISGFPTGMIDEGQNTEAVDLEINR